MVFEIWLFCFLTEQKHFFLSFERLPEYSWQARWIQSPRNSPNRSYLYLGKEIKLRKNKFVLISDDMSEEEVELPLKCLIK